MTAPQAKIRSIFSRGGGDRDALFDTDYLKKNLSSRAAKGGVIVFASQIVKFITQTGSQVVLARLLAPEDFGLIAMVMVFSGFMHLFQDMGLTVATVQRKQVTHRQVSVLFWINMGMSLLLASLFAGLSPVLAWFYDEPRVIGVAVALSGTFVIAGLSAQHRAILRRHMRYLTLAKINITSNLLAVTMGITLAALGFGYWALIAMMIGQSGVAMLLVWIASPWCPSLVYKTEGMGSLLKFGGNMTLFNIVNYFTRNADNLMLGATWGAATLGLYSKAYAMLLLPIKQINSPIAAVAMPALSRLQDEPVRFANCYCRMLQVAAYISMPVVMLFIILSEEAVLILLGDKWIEAVPIFRVLSILAFGQTVQNSTGWVMVAYNRTGRMFKWSVIQGACAVTSFAIGLSWGGYGVAVAAAICGMTLLLPALAYAYHDTPIRLARVGKVLIRPLVFTGLILVTAWPTRYMLEDQMIWIRVAATLLASGLIVGLTVLFWKQAREDLLDVKRALKKK